MKIRDVMSKKEPFAVLESDTYQEVVKNLHEHRISGAPVVNEEGNLVGLISEKDLFRAIHPSYKKFYENPERYLDFESREEKVKELRNKKVSEFMTKKVITVGPDDPVLKVGALMLARGVHRMPVMDGKKLLGVVTRRRIYGNLLRHNLGLDK